MSFILCFFWKFLCFWITLPSNFFSNLVLFFSSNTAATMPKKTPSTCSPASAIHTIGSGCKFALHVCDSVLPQSRITFKLWVMSMSILVVDLWWPKNVITWWGMNNCSHHSVEISCFESCFYCANKFTLFHLAKSDRGCFFFVLFFCLSLHNHKSLFIVLANWNNRFYFTKL